MKECFFFGLAIGAFSLSMPSAIGQTTPTITQQPVSQTALAGTNVTLGVSVSGAGPFTYQWQFDGTNIPNGIITTVAGNGTNGCAGDGGVATNAELYYPRGVVMDAFGNLFVVDCDSSRIRRVGTQGSITTVAGNGFNGYSGDGRLATKAELYYPWTVAMDVSGNLFIADTYNNRIREVGTNGIITTVAGNGGQGYSGDGGAATNAELANPSGIAVDGAGNLFIADTYNDRIREVGTNGIITTVAGNGTAGYSGDGGVATNAEIDLPRSVAVDGYGNLFIADTGSNCIREVGTNGIVTTIAGGGNNSFYSGGPATNAKLNQPQGIAVDGYGNLFIADTYNNCVREVETNGIITTLAGEWTNGYSGNGGPATKAELTKPGGVTVDASGNLYIADTYNNRVREVVYPTTNLVLQNVAAGNAGSYDVVVSSPYGSVTSSVVTLTVDVPPAITNQPANLALTVGDTALFSVTSGGAAPLTYQWQFNGSNLLGATNPILAISNVQSANMGTYDVLVINAFGEAISQTATLMVGTPPSVVTQPANQTVWVGTNVTFSMSVSGAGPFTYQWQFDGTNISNGIITTIAGGGNNYRGDGGPATNAVLDNPFGVAVDGFGNLYIADGNSHIRRVGTNGIITTVAGNGTYGYSGDGGPATNAELGSPWGVAVDGFGNLFIADTENSRIREVGTNGIITSVAGNGTGGYSGDGGPATNATLNNPHGVTVDGFGNLFIADGYNQRIREVGTNGIITTVAGNGYANQWNQGGYSGDGGASTSAELNWPLGVAVDGFGNLFIADTENSCVREVVFQGTNFVFLPNVAISNAGTYDVVVSNPYGSVTSSVVTLTVEALPTIVSQPTNLVLAVGGTATFSATVSGTAPLIYQWQFDGANLSKATNPVLAISNAQLANTGTYDMLVTNLYGETNSQTAILTVGTPPSVATQPANQTVLAGTSVTCGMLVSGTGPFIYQWQFDGTNLPNGIITTVAGNGTNGYSGDGGPATSAELGYPVVVAVDTFGNLFITVADNNCIRKVETNGIITTVAGNGTYGYSGDGGPATNAELWGPGVVAVDAFGNLFIADTWNDRIHKVGINGIITTVAGNGTEAYSGDGGPATNAELNQPLGVAVDGFGNLFIADSGNQCVREVNTNGIITTVAGNGTGGYSGDGGPATNAELGSPFGVSVDAFDNLFIADTDNNCIRRVDTNGIITTVAGNGTGGYSGDGGAATSAELHWPAGVSVDAFGNLFIADTWNDRIRKVEINGIITTMAGNGTNGYAGDGSVATSAELSGPNGVTVDAFGSLFIADSGNQRIRKVVFQGASLVFPSVAVSNAGSYDVVVTSPYGSMTSSVVTLTVTQITPVVTPFNLSNFGFASSNTFQIQFTNTPGATFSLWASTNLCDWTQIGTATEDLPGVYEASDPSATNCGVRFYQLRWP